MFYLITGENTPLIDDEKSKICSSHQGIPFETTNQGASLENFMLTLASCDLFSPIKGHILIEPKWLKKLSKEDLETLEKTLLLAKNFGAPVIFILKKVDKRSACYKLLKKHAFIEKNFEIFKEWETQKIIDWLTNHCKKNACTIDSKAAQMLIDAYGSNMGIIKQEIEKCMVAILPKTTITSTDLLHASSNAVGEYSLLSTAIKKGDASGIIFHMDQLMNQKEDPHKIFNQLLFQINQQLPFAFAYQQKIPAEKLANSLGRHPFFVKKQLESMANNPLHPKLSKILMILAHADKLMKTGKLTAKQALIELSNKLKYQI